MAGTAGCVHQLSVLAILLGGDQQDDFAMRSTSSSDRKRWAGSARRSAPEQTVETRPNPMAWRCRGPSLALSI
jgi:hypothetical protein